MVLGMFFVSGVALQLGCSAPGDSETGSARREHAVDSSRVDKLEVAQICTECERLRRVARFDVVEGDGIIDESRYVALDSLGRVLVSSSTGLRVYDIAAGFQLKRGRRGKGPMEFQSPGPVFFNRDKSVRVFDKHAFRETVLTFATLELDTIRRLPLGLIQDAIPLDDSTLIVAAEFLDKSARGSPLHMIRGDSIIRSFGLLLGKTPKATAVAPLDRQIAGVTERGSLVVARSDRYLLEVWSLDGDLQMQVVRPGLWETVEEASNKVGILQRPHGTLRDAIIDGGTVLVTSHRPRADWRTRAIPEKDPAASQLYTYRTSPTEMWESVVERIDPGSGRVLSQMVANSTLLSGFLGPTMLWGYSYGDDGRPILEIIKVERSTPPDAR